MTRRVKNRSKAPSADGLLEPRVIVDDVIDTNADRVSTREWAIRGVAKLLPRQRRRVPPPSMSRGTLAPLRASGVADGELIVGVLVYRGVTSAEVDEPVRRLAMALNAGVTYVAASIGEVAAVEPARVIVADASPETVPEIDVLVVPGGLGWRQVAADPTTARWLTEAADHARGVLTMSTGSLLLASVGRLSGRKATGHWLGQADLAAFGAHVRSDRTARDESGRLVTTVGALAALNIVDDLAGFVLWSEPSQDPPPGR